MTSETTSGQSSADYFPFTTTTLHPCCPAGFQQSVAFSGLTQPVAVRFAGDGRVFVAEKSGLIKVFASVPRRRRPCSRIFVRRCTAPSTPDCSAWRWTRRSHQPYIYVLYTLDAPIGGTPPVWHDSCPTPPGADAGCVISARLSRLQAAGNVMTGAEKVLINDWCQQYASHSIGTVMFGADGALYASAGDGAAYTRMDYGQGGVPTNPCGDPPVPVGGAQTPPTAEGGMLRSQDLVTPDDPVTLDGSIIRVDPDDRLRHGPTTPTRPAPIPTSVGSWPPGCATVPHDRVQARTSCGSATSVGTLSEEIDRVADPTATGRELRMALLRRQQSSSRATMR